MSKKRERITNPEPFSPFNTDCVSSKKHRRRPPKQHQLQDELLPSSVSSKILKQALLQKKEILHEEKSKNNPKNSEDNNNSLVFRNVKDNSDDEDDEVDDFEGFSETQSQFGQWDFEDEMYKEDEKLIENFLSKEDHHDRTLADIIVEKIKERDAQVSSGVQPIPKIG